LIEKVYIINKAGVAIFSKTYNHQLQDDDMMISGFLIAISQFAKQVTQKGSVEEIKLADITFKYKKMENITVIFRGSGLANTQDLDHKLTQLGTAFLIKFKDIIENWDGKLSRFDTFKEKVDEVVQTQNEQIILEIIELIDAEIDKKNKDIQIYIKYIQEFKNRISLIEKNNQTLIKSIIDWRNNIVNSKFSLFSDDDFKDFIEMFEKWKTLVLKEHKDQILEKLNALEF